MLPSIYQQQHQQQQQQQQQQQNEFNCGTNSQMCSMMMTTDCLKSASVQNMSPPFRDFSSQLNSSSGKSSQLKETHSALVKILESAPIPSNTSTTTATIATTTNTTDTTVPQSFTKTTTMLLVNQTNQQNNYHRKRNKHLNTINTHCDMDKSSDEEMGCNSNSSASSNASEAEIICPWKKTRIAREWHQSQNIKMDDDAMDRITTVTVPTVPTINLNIQSNNNDGEYDAGDDISDDNGENDENSNICECYNTWRRASNDGDDDDELHENHHHHTGTSTKKHKSFHSGQNNGTDSGCDSDCPENISELCKKFDENLSEQDGFFRRSIQQKIQYRPCTKNQQCSILRINRNRCQYCRLKKCIAVGMSRDAVRFGRVPKREKARILAAMQQSTQNRGHQRAMATELDDQPRLLAAVLRAHMETCEFTREKVASMRQRARECPSYSLPTMACPLNPAPELQSEQEFSQRFAHVIRGVIDFAGMIPGFQLLTQDDKFTLLKAGLFDALFVRLICMFDTSINSIICLNGQVMRRNSIQNGANARFLVDSTFNFAERMNAMNLSDSEIGLFCAIVLISADRPGLRNIELVEKMHSRLKGCLQTVISQNRPDDPDFMIELLKLLPDLRTLSTLHTEKLVVFRTEHKEMLRQQMWSMEEESSKSSGLSPWGCNDQVIEEVTKSPMGSVSSTESGDTTSDYSQSLSQSAPLLAATLAGGCPMRLRANSGSSAEDDIVGTHHLTQNGLTITPVVRSTTAAHHIRYRKLDSPTDSGIESGNEKADHKAASSESSSCSSPRSSVDDMNEEKRPIAEDMPVLKRVLQAPPLYDTNSLMDEAYKPHKKFRALRHREYEAEADSVQQHHLSSHSQQQPQQQQSHSSELPQSQPISEKPALSPPQTNPHQSQLHMHLTRPNSHQHSSSAPTHHHQSSLSSTHSVLARSLMEEPRMTPEQMKRSDIITSYIKRESQVEQQRVSSQSGLLVCALSSGSNSHRSSPLNATASAMPPKQCPYTGASTNRWQNGTTLSVITTTRHNTEPTPMREDVNMIQDGVDARLKSDASSPTSSSPHSTSSTSPAMPNSTASMDEDENPMLRSTMVSLLQPLNLSKKSPSPVQHQLSSCF